MKQKFVIKICCKVLLLMAISFTSSCQSSDEVYLYDKSSFLPARQSQQDNFRNQNFYQQRAPQPYNPYSGMMPNSRAYSNPYDFQQPGGYYPYYDTERYYVPPSYYRNVEPTFGSPGGMDMKY